MSNHPRRATAYSFFKNSAFTYDGAGNITSDGICSPTPCWKYDYAGHMTSSSSGASYLYDGLGRRQQKTDTAGNIHSFVLGPDGQPYDEYVGPTWTRTTAGLFTYANSTTYFNHTDERGTPKLSTDYTGAVKRTEDSSGNIMGPFGDNFTETLSTLDYTGFAGGFWDVENNGFHFGAREYEPLHGTWRTPDPAGMAAADLSNPQSWNLYAYVMNDPVNNTDPSGLDCIYDNGDGTATVYSGDCLKLTDNGFYVNGTVGQDSQLILDQSTGDLQVGNTAPNGSYGTTDILGFADPLTSNAGQLPALARVVFGSSVLQTAAATMTDPRTYALWAGASAVSGFALVGSGAIGGGAGLTTLAGEDGLGLVGNQAINQSIGAAQRELLKDFFESGKLPEGLSQRTLELYKEVAQRAIAAGKDQLGVQAARIEMINNALY